MARRFDTLTKEFLPELHLGNSGQSDRLAAWVRRVRLAGMVGVSNSGGGGSRRRWSRRCALRRLEVEACVREPPGTQSQRSVRSPRYCRDRQPGV